MNNLVISLIRTYVPIIVGAIVAFLATKGLSIDSDTQAAAVIAFTGIIQAVYYSLVRILEQKFPKLGGILLGKTATPDYTKEV